MELTMVDGAVLRGVMRRLPSPVTVVTAANGEEARGITIGSFTSVSLEPPLISFNVEREAQMHDVLTSAARFAVHFLSEEQAPLCTRFARPDCSGAEQFAEVAHAFDGHGTPLLEGVLAILHCRPYAALEAGDHTIVVGEVVAVEAYAEGAPLLYYNRTFCSVEQEGRPFASS